MKLFIAGDYKHGMGPANVTLNIIRTLGSEAIYQKQTNKLLRVLEIIYNTCICNAVVYSGFSAQNIIGFRIAKFLKRPSFYLMHGSILIENQLNKNPDQHLLALEQTMLKHADFILTVSEPFEKWAKLNYSLYQNKIYHIVNGIDWNLLVPPKQMKRKNANLILTSGGGLPEKNILDICKAIDLIYTTNPKCALILKVIGPDDKDTDSIKAYPFVQYEGLVNHQTALSYMQEACLYVQNSLFETFGLAPIEALCCGCNLLVSKKIGAISILNAVQASDLIYDPQNINELSNKIEYLFDHSNYERLYNSIDKETTSIEHRVDELKKLIIELGGIK